ncbi:MAG: family 1 glycosylhydrolase [Blastochloris sp.]|nr:family 1 glycosylhydrolase [Blastochloris sp.]
MSHYSTSSTTPHRPTSLNMTPENFFWATGIEDTFVPQARSGMRPLDEYELMGHYEHWRADLDVARDLGARAIRWGIPWYRVEPQPGVFDWSWTDQVIPYIVEELGLELILDLMHYGTPSWLAGSFIDPDYPQAVAAYARAVAERYGHLLRYYTPLNEPLVNALNCGQRGVWPPYLRGDSGYVRVMMQLALGIVATVKAICEVDPQALMVHVEATGLSRAADADLAALVEEDHLRRILSYDLITGRVVPGHPLLTWLLRNGAQPAHLRALATDPISLDILGLNFYPQWSTLQLDFDRRGRLTYRKVEKDGPGFAELIELHYRRYNAPVMITETSATGSDRTRAAWLDTSLAAVRDLRARGVPVIGYTWFPLYTMIDWRYRFGKAPIEQYHLELGMYRLGDDGEPRWRPTTLVERFRRAVADPHGSIGPFVPGEV